MIRVSIADTGKIYVTINDDGPIRIRMVGVEPIRINAFNYPPEIARLNQEIIAAKEDAANAADLATQANQAASQAAQVAQEAETIAEGAATSAGEAVQAINEHSQANTNPHATDVTQEFAEVNVTGLKSDASGGNIPASLYSWFKGLFPSLVDGSVKSWIIGIVTQLKWLTDNIGGGYLLKYTVPADTNAISLTVDKNGQPFNFVEGDKIEIVAKFAFSTAAEPRLRLNNVISNVYRYGAFGFTSFGIATIGRATFGGVIELTVLNNEVYGFSSIINETDTTRNTNTYALKTVGINQNAITSFQFFCATASHQYLAGSQILIRKK